MTRSRFPVRIARRLIGALLTPVIAAELLAAFHLMRAAPPSLDLLAFATGFALWLILFHSLPRPFRAYVLAHELSHAVWGFFTGSAISDLRVSRRGGSVRISNPGLFSTLAPYFLPIYSLLVLAAFGVTALFFDPDPWKVPWMAALGASWGFHVSFTFAISFDARQPDLRAYGRFFSAVLILAINLALLLAALTLLGPFTWKDLFSALSNAAEWIRAFAMRAIPGPA